MEWRARSLMLVFDRMDPSSTVGGASNEAGPSSSVHGEVAVSGLAGGVAEEIPENGAEPGEGGVKAGGSSLKPGLFGEGRRVVGERERLAWSFSMRAEFLLALVGRGEVTPGGCSWSPPWFLGSCSDRGGRRLTGFVSFAASCGQVESLNLPASSATELRHAASS